MPVLLYWFGIRLYVFLARIASLFNTKAKQFIKGRRGLIKKIHYSLIDEQRERIWIHCASLGEFEQGKPVIERLKKDYPSHAIVLTFFSPSGYEVRKNYSGADYVFYLPFDSASKAKKFVRLVQPALAVFVKYEYWYFYLNRLAKENIPTILISAIFRKDQVFFKWYGVLHRKMLSLFNKIFVQDEPSVRLLNSISIEDAHVAGDTRFDTVFKTAQNAKPLELLDEYCADSKIIVAGSTWGDDEQLLNKAFGQLPDNWKLIIAPHEVDEEHLSQIKKLFTHNSVLWSNYRPEDKSSRVLIIDTIGLLSTLYIYADIAYIGGGFNKSGIHNMLEAATYGVPIAHGPNYHKFKEAKDLLAAGSSFVCNSEDEFLQKLKFYEANIELYNTSSIAAKDYVENNRGATELIITYVQAKLLAISV